MEKTQTSSYFELISHPDRTLREHLQQCNEISQKVLEHKFVSESFWKRTELDFFRKILVFFHDLGKGTRFFQHRILKATQEENPDFLKKHQGYLEGFYRQNRQFDLEEELAKNKALGYHAQMGAIAFSQELRDPDPILLFILSEIIRRHHGNLHNFEDSTLVLSEREKETLFIQYAALNSKGYMHILDPTGLDLPNDLEKVLKSHFSVRKVSKMLRALKAADDVSYYFLLLFLFSLLLSADKGDMMLSDKSLAGQMQRFPVGLVDQYKKRLFGSTPPTELNLIREEAYNQVCKNLLAHSEHTFFSITLPTGMGKTFTAYNAAIRLQNKLSDYYGKEGEEVVPRIIYCLPFTAIIDQNAAILNEMLEGAGISDGFLARHHYLSEHNNSYPGYQSELTYDEAEYLTEGWEYNITVTTFVQLLESMLTNRNRSLRKFHNLANAIIILDEVQNIPPKYFETLEVLFERMGRYFNTKFIFVTATQPVLIKRQSVIELTDPEGDKTREYFEQLDRIELDVRLWQNGVISIDQLGDLFLEEIGEQPDKSFLLILNSKKSAQQTFLRLKNELPSSRPLLFLSSEILPVERKKRIQVIRESASNAIVVSTQVVEAGVDIDMDVVFRAFAPIDSINQSAGRCNRNALKGKGVVKLFQLDEKFSVYDRILLTISEKILKEFGKKHLGLIPEAAFYRMNQSYAKKIREAVADESVQSRLIDYMKRLQLEKIQEEFKLIDKTYKEAAVFIEIDETAEALWVKYRLCAEIDDQWERKKALKNLRPQLLQYVVNFPQRQLPPDFQNDSKPILRLSKDTYPAYYDLKIGIKREELSPPTQTF